MYTIYNLNQALCIGFFVRINDPNSDMLRWFLVLADEFNPIEW